jgi:outer membrane protein assembly factor BamB
VADGPAPLSWDVPKGKNVAWKTPLPGLAHSSPVVWGHRVFVTTAISSDAKAETRFGLYGDVEPAKDVSRHSWRVYALDRTSGRIVWERTAAEGVPKVKRHPKSSQASASPATDGKHVVAWFGSEGLYTYDVDGRLLWKRDLGLVDPGWFFDPDYQWNVGSSPVTFQNMVIVQVDRQKDSFIAAFDLHSGKPLWRTARPEIPSWGTPTIVRGPGRTEIVTNGTKAIRGYDPETGRELWTLSPNSEVTVTTPVFAGGLIFVANGYPPVQPIYAIKPGASGDISLAGDAESNASIAWSKTRGGPYMPTPLAYDGILYLCSNNGVLSAYDATTGERIYQQRVAGQGTGFTASPIAAGGRIYVASEDGDVFVVKAGRAFELLATNPVGEVLMATPAIVDGMMVIRGLSHLIGVR